MDDWPVDAPPRESEGIVGWLQSPTRILDLGAAPCGSVDAEWSGAYRYGDQMTCYQKPEEGLRENIVPDVPGLYRRELFPLPQLIF